MSFSILHVKDVRKGRARLQCPVCDAMNERPWIDFGCSACGVGTNRRSPIVWMSHGADGLHAYLRTTLDRSHLASSACGKFRFYETLDRLILQDEVTRRGCCADCWARVVDQR